MPGLVAYICLSTDDTISNEDGQQSGNPNVENLIRMPSVKTALYGSLTHSK